HLAGRIHRLDFLLVAARRRERADLIIPINVHCPSSCRRSENILNPSGVVHTATARSAGPDSDIAAAGDIIASQVANSDIADPVVVVVKRLVSKRAVLAATGNARKRPSPKRVVRIASHRVAESKR